MRNKWVVRTERRARMGIRCVGAEVRETGTAQVRGRIALPYTVTHFCSCVSIQAHARQARERWVSNQM